MTPELHLLEPYAAVLALPALAAWWLWARHGYGRWWRLVVLALLVLAATRPELAWERGGSDVILVLDRSASMDEARKSHDEVIKLVAEQRRTGDRLGVVLMGDGAVIAQGPQHTGTPVLGEHPLRDGGSDLAAALDQAASLLAPKRSARVIVHSDGESTGIDPRSAAVSLGLAGIPVDVLVERRPLLPDAAVLDVELPGDLRLGESFIGAVRLISDVEENRSWQVMRDGRAVGSGTVRLLPFRPQTVTFADRPIRAGVTTYEVTLGSQGAGGQIAARFVDLWRHMAGVLPPTLAGDAAKHIATFEAMAAKPEMQAVFQQLVIPGAARDAAIGMVMAQLRPHLGETLSKVAQQQLLNMLDKPVVDRDRQPLNNVARASLRIAGGERVLVISGDGQDGNIARALRAAGMTVDVRGEGPVSLEDLIGIRVLVLDQVPADRLTLAGMQAIARWVEHLGGGLVLTGGRRSFGSGGYHKSPVERVLPVTMELRDEHRKLAVAMAITLDRSGSMGAPVGNNRTKMDLANEGAAAVIELLGPRDQVAVHAVDSAPHVVLPLTKVENPKALVGKVLGIESGGGGIFVYQALVAAGKELVDAHSGTRHLVLFADAADAEEPGDYINLLAQYAKAGITTSVVAMGTANDVDAKFLEDVARRGNGRIAFAEAPEDLPRLFAQETMLVARSSWIGEPSTLKPKARLGIDLGSEKDLAEPWPTVSGYNLTYPRDRAQIWAMAPGDPAAPALAAWHVGGGRSVAVCIDLDDPQSPQLLGWGGYAPLIAGVVRWVGGGGEQGPGQITAERAGRSVTVRLELDPAQESRWPLLPPAVVLAREGELTDARQVPLQAVDRGRYEAVISLDDDAVVVPASTVDQHAILGPALRLPYSPEAEPRFGRKPGAELLASLARDTGGRVRNDLVDAFDNPPSPGTLVDVSLLLLTVALVLSMGEILVRRLQLGWRRRPHPIVPSATTTAATAPPPLPSTVATGTEAVPGAAPPPDEGLHEALRQLRKRH
jgi:Mg-chelatase subunit ChlD